MLRKTKKKIILVVNWSSMSLKLTSETGGETEGTGCPKVIQPELQQKKSNAIKGL